MKQRRSLREFLKSLDPRAGHRSLLFQAVLWVAIPFSLTMTVGAVYGLANNVQTRENEFLERGARAGLLAAQALAPAASSADPEALTAALAKLAGNSELVYASVHDVTGKELARHGPVPAALIAPTSGGVRVDDAGMIHQSVELTHRGAAVGTAWFGLKFNPKFRLVGVTVKDTVTMIVVTSIIAVLMGLLLGRSFGKIFDRILKTIRATAESVDVAAKQLNAATAEQSSASAESASALAETQAVAVEVGTAAATASARAQLLDEVAGRSEVEADEAIRAVAEAQVAVKALREQGHAIDEAIRGFSDKATAVGEIAASVSMLAERSNLLALNAAIEASRAGERGRAFSVVSREMRTLAEATNRSAEQVKTIVLDVQGAVAQWTTDSSTGTRKMELAEQATSAAVEAIRGFGRSTHELAGVGKEIASSGKDQRSAIDQTVDALKQANAAGAEQLDAIRVLEGSSGKLAALSHVLIDTIDGKDTEETRSVGGAAQQADGHGGHRAALRKTMLYIVVPFAILVLVNTAIAVSNLPSDYDHRLRLVASHHFEGLAPAAQLALESEDRTALRTMLGTLAKRDALIYAVAQDADGRTLAAYGALPEKLTADPEGSLQGEVFRMSRVLPGGAQLFAGYSVGPEKTERTRGAWIVIRLALLITMLGAVMAWVVNRRYGTVFERLLTKVRGAALRLDELVSQLAAIAAQQAATSSESAAALQETRASAEEVGRGAAASSARAMLLASGGEASEFDAGNATEAVTKAREAIRSLREHVTDLTQRIALFADRADAIGNVATTVAMLSERSDLLAVNASIEAARSAAGGVQGFGVVAEEMRALADGSSKSAQQVKDIVSDVRSALRRALDDAREGERRARAAEVAADSAAKRVDRFAEVAHEFVRLGNEIGAAATQQRSAIDQMVEAVTQAAEGSATQAMATQSVQQVATALVALSASLVEVTGATVRSGDVTTLRAGQGGGGADKGQPTAVAA